MRVLIWHQHGSWTTSFVQGPHTYLVPVVPDRGPDGRGRARTWDWPPSVHEVTPEQLRDETVDCVILQRSRDLDLARAWTGREPGVDVPALWVEHDTPPTVTTRHPLADRTDIPVVHVTPFNDVAWDNGVAPHTVVEHGVPDLGERWIGDVERAAVVTNDPVSRGRVVGTDLLAPFARGGVPLDVFGMRVQGMARALDLPPAAVGEHEDLPQERMHDALVHRRLYLHLTRWTSLGLSLVEAMTLGMPVVVLATTDAVRAVPPEAGVVSTDVAELVAGARRLLRDPSAAALAGKAARRAALERYGLDRFLADWDRLLTEVTT